MSSHEVTPHKPLEHVCRVGYDPANDTYFYYVSRPLITDERTGYPVGNNNGHMIEWKGLRPREIDSVEQLAQELEPYATLPKALFQKLRDERLRRRRETAKGLAPAQR